QLETPSRDVAGSHQCGQLAESTVKGEFPPPVTRVIDNIVDDQGDVVKQFEPDRRTEQLRRYNGPTHGPVTGKDGEWPKILRSSLELPLQHLAHLFTGGVYPFIDEFLQPVDFRCKPQPRWKICDGNVSHMCDGFD